MKEFIRKLIIENLIPETLFKESSDLDPCDCCQYFDYKSLSNYTGIEHPLYSILEKGRKEQLKYISPKQYIYKIAHGFGGLSYADVADSGAVVKDNVKRYAKAMKDGDKFPIGYYTEGGSNQEGRHRALALMELGCEQMPIVVISEFSRDKAREFVEKHKDITFEQLDAYFKAGGYHGISGLDWREFKSFVEYRL